MHALAPDPVGLAPRVTPYRITGESDLSLETSAAIPMCKSAFYGAMLEALKLHNFLLHVSELHGIRPS